MIKDLLQIKSGQIITPYFFCKKTAYHLCRIVLFGQPVNPCRG